MVTAKLPNIQFSNNIFKRFLQNYISINFHLFDLSILNNNTYESFNLISSTRIYKNNSSKEKNNITVNPSEEDDYYNCLKILAENLVLMNKRNRVIRIYSDQKCNNSISYSKFHTVSSSF
jgi:hypothetical protein